MIQTTLINRVVFLNIQIAIILADLAKEQYDKERKKLLKKLKEEKRKVYGILENSKDTTMNISTELNK